MSDAEISIRIMIFKEGYKGEDHEVFSPADFGGVIPLVGDLIIDPGVLQGRDRSDPINRTILEVLRRYFRPAAGGAASAYVQLVVAERQGLEDEGHILPG